MIVFIGFITLLTSLIGSVQAFAQEEVTYAINVSARIKPDPDPPKPLVQDTLFVKLKGDLAVTDIETKYYPASGSIATYTLNKSLTAVIHNPIVMFEKRQGIYTYSTGYRPARTEKIEHALNFGTIHNDMRPGAVFISPHGNRSVMAGSTLEGSGCQPGKLFVSGDAGMDYTLSFPDSVILLAKDTTATLMLRYITPSTTEFKLDSLGQQTIKLGGMLDIQPNQLPGEYKGIMEIKLYYFKEPKIIYVE